MASSTSGQNNPLTYMDGISVKIAENYKPPKRIPMVMSYSQRVALNKLIQEPVLTYDFSMEESVKNKMYEWQKARTAVIEQRKQRLNQVTQALNTKWETNENISDKEVLDSKDSIKTDSTDKTPDKTLTDTRVSAADPYYQTESGILIPKVLSSQQSKILMPTPLANSYVHSDELRDFKSYSHKNPINYSEFESDTSSPFDNMELKIINDLEELAQVLKHESDDTSITCSSVGANHQKSFVTTCPKTTKLMNYVTDNMYSKLDNHMPIYGLDHTVNSKKIPVNGYYYDNYSQNALTAQMATSKDTPIRSVSEIMKSLQADLAGTRLVSEPKNSVTPSPDTASVPSAATSDMLEDPFKHLNPDLQRMALTISSMGFPLPRVARACQLLDGNQKKVVEHLLAMSELLDLGFPEQKVATALFKSENDRDKALDLLIT